VNVLVTGSSGLIGSALVERLTAADHRVTRLVRGASPGRPTRARVTEVTWDPADGTLDSEGLRRAGPFDGVVNLAGAGIGDRRWSAARKRVILSSRTSATSLLVESLLDLSPRPAALVSASAIGFYGDRGDEELTEASSTGAGFLASVCRAWEAEARPAADAGIRTVLLRTGIVLSGGGGMLDRLLPLFRVGLGGRTGTGRQYRSWITLDDEVSVILHCLEDHGVSGPVNATAPFPATDGELARALGTALHRPTALAAPAGALRLLLGAEMAQELILGGQRVLPATLTAGGFQFAHTHLDQAVRALLAPGG
jgi:uncharacterized protein (TIGR01777 family)